MKYIFLIQGYPLLSKINYSEIKSQCDSKIYLIGYDISQNQLESYLMSTNQIKIFEKVFVVKNLEYDKVYEILSYYSCEFKNNELIIATSSESAVHLCGKLRHAFGIANDDLLRYTDKNVMKKSLGGYISIPRYIQFDTKSYTKNKSFYLKYIYDQLSFPLFVKPTDQNGSFGTKILSTKTEFSTWAESQNIMSTYEIDEYIEGTLYHCDSFIKNNKIIFTQVCEYLYPCYDFILGKPLGSITLPQNSPLSHELVQFNNSCLKKMKPPKDGITHLEVFKKPQGELVFLEVAARAPGALVPQMYKKYLNMNVREAHLLLQIDQNYIPRFLPDTYCAWISFPRLLGTIKRLITPKLKSLYEIEWKANIGDQLVSPQKITDTIGNVIFWDKDFEKVYADFKSFSHFNAVELNKMKAA